MAFRIARAPASRICYMALDASADALQVDNGMTIVNSTASYSRKTAARVVGEERLKPVDNLVSSAQKTVSDGVETVKNKGVFGAAQEGFYSAWDGVQNAGSYAKKTVLEVNQSVTNGASAVKEKLDPALKSAYDKWLVPAGTSLLFQLRPLHGATHGSVCLSASPHLCPHADCAIAFAVLQHKNVRTVLPSSASCCYILRAEKFGLLTEVTVAPLVCFFAPAAISILLHSTLYLVLLATTSLHAHFVCSQQHGVGVHQRARPHRAYQGVRNSSLPHHLDRQLPVGLQHRAHAVRAVAGVPLPCGAAGCRAVRQAFWPICQGHQEAHEAAGACPSLPLTNDTLARCFLQGAERLSVSWRCQSCAACVRMRVHTVRSRSNTC